MKYIIGSIILLTIFGDGCHFKQNSVGAEVLIDKSVCITHQVNKNVVMGVISFYPVKQEITDTSITTSILYAVEYATSDTVRIICSNSKINKPYTGTLVVIKNDSNLIANRKVYALDDSLLSKRLFKTSVGFIQFLLE